MNSIHQELVNFFLFFRCIVTVGFVTGLIVIPLALIGHELWKRVHRG